MNTQKTQTGNSNYKTSDPGLSIGNYVYKSKKQKNKSKYDYYFVQPSEAAQITSGQQFNVKCGNRFALYQNQTDSSKTYVAIKFYLQEPADTKLILLDSDGTDVIYFINQKLEAGRHTFVTEIRNEELSRFSYYYKLDVNGCSEVKQMKYVM